MGKSVPAAEILRRELVARIEYLEDCQDWDLDEGVKVVEGLLTAAATQRMEMYDFRLAGRNAAALCGFAPEYLDTLLPAGSWAQEMLTSLADLRSLLDLVDQLPLPEHKQLVAEPAEMAEQAMGSLRRGLPDWGRKLNEKLPAGELAFALEMLAVETIARLLVAAGAEGDNELIGKLLVPFLLLGGLGTNAEAASIYRQEMREAVEKMGQLVGLANDFGFLFRESIGEMEIQ